MDTFFSNQHKVELRYPYRDRRLIEFMLAFVQGFPLICIKLIFKKKAITILMLLLDFQ